MPFTYRLILEDGTPADPPTFASSTPTWREGDTVLIRPGRVLRIIAIDQLDDADVHAVWTVELAY